MARLIGGSIIAIFWAVLLGVTALVCYEYAVPKEQLAENDPLKRSGYYKTDVADSPYKQFAVQHLHPKYFFFFPLDPDERTALNNEVVTLTADGFRGKGVFEEKPLAVLLGGSAAFGVFASTDQTTITGYLNQLQTSYHFVNAGVPSWNSTQELHRLADQIAPLRPKLVVSYSFSNDIVIALRYAEKSPVYPAGTPENFDSLSSAVDNIRGSTKMRAIA